MPSTITHEPLAARAKSMMGSRVLWIVAGVVFAVFSIALRLLFLNTTPASISHDEVYYAIESRAVALTGHDLTGKWAPWQLRPANLLYAELPGTVMSIFGRFFSDPFLAARITHILFGVTFSFLLTGVIYGLFKDQRIALICLVLASFNPWLFQFSRLGFDALLSLTFYFAALAIVLNSKSWWKLSSLPFWFLGFFQYQGLKIVFLPMIGLLVLYEYAQQQAGQFLLPAKKEFVTWLRKTLPLLVIGTFGLLLFCWYLVQLPKQAAGSRSQDIIFFSKELAKLVNTDRRLTLLNPLQTVFTNKPLIVVREVISKYAQAFNPLFLFVQGESIRNPFSVWSVGIFHLFDVVLLVIGVVVAWQQKRWRLANLFLLGLILIAPLPSAINAVDSWIMFRSSLLFPLLLIYMVIGANWLWSQKGPVLKLGLLIVYAFSLSWFGYQYFFRYPIYSTKGVGFAERVMANYIHRVSKDHQVVVLTSESEFVFETYLFYNNLVTRENLPALKEAFNSRKFVLGNVSFDTNCVDLSSLKPDTVIIDEAIGTVCEDPKKKVPPFPPVITAIPSLLDSGAIFKLYNDKFCSHYNLASFSQVQSRELLNVEGLDDETFCRSHLIYP